MEIMVRPQRSEVWRVDLGLAGKVRPALVVSASLQDADYALIAVVPHTTSVRGANYEVALSVPFLRQGAFNVQGLAPLPPVRFPDRLGKLSDEQMNQIDKVMDRWLCLD
ncbi:MAG: type II toxin-antitoxin system PemK/MazF family toxin [Methylacidiphilales bacterium]|nr:type II toxin-antitoxin system PemK/MazF family toxin [Candidatus Methylacidiphilales bacterium]